MLGHDGYCGCITGNSGFPFLLVQDCYMGWFSGETRVYVGTSVSRVVKDSLLPNARKSGLIKGIVTSEDIPESVMEAIAHSMGNKVERAYEYAKRSYTYGLPSGQYQTASIGESEVTTVLETLEGSTVTTDYYRFGPANKFLIAWVQLITDYGYDPDTNTFLSTAAYLYDFYITIPEAMVADTIPESLYIFGPPATAGITPWRTLDYTRNPTLIHTDPTATDISVTVISVADAFGDPSYTTTTFTLTAAYGALDYFQAIYTVGGAKKFWLYADDTGTYPVLDSLFVTGHETHGTFFPMLYFRYNGISAGTDTTTEAYKTSKKLAKYLGINYAQLIDAVNTNASIAEVRQAILVFAVPANTVDLLEQRYLFDFFNTLYAKDIYAFGSVSEIGTYLSGYTHITTSQLVIQDACFKWALNYEAIIKETKTGIIGTPGAYASGTGTVNIPRQFIDILGDLVTVAWATPTHHYQQQITVDTYVQITVIGLASIYDIYGDKQSLGTAMDPILLVPLDYSIVSLYSGFEREILYIRAMHYVFNSVHFQEVAWYQTSVFANIVNVVAFAMMVASLGELSAPARALAAAVKSGSMVAIIDALIPFLVPVMNTVYYAVLFKLLTKLVGVEIATILYILVAFKSMRFDGNTGTITGVPTAKELLQLVNGLVAGSNTLLVDALEGLRKEYEEFNLLKTAQDKQLEAAQKLLEHNNWLNPFVIFGEKPNDYYNRTIHSGNIGIVGISAISYYVDNALTLPSFQTTLGTNRV